MPQLSLETAQKLVHEKLLKHGCSSENARSVAQALTLAEADGLKGHGLSRLPSYVGQLKAGKVDGGAVPLATRNAPGVINIDAAHGFAFPALDLALAQLGEPAASCGLAVATIRRSHHSGAAGHPVERLAEQGLVAMFFANTPAAMAPWGGRKPLFGTNPIAFACPLEGMPPLVIDLSLSKVARGNIMAAKQKGMPIPEGWALDGEGRPTTDPDAALAGTMVPMGDAKGTALALMVELLAAGLTGAKFASEASSFLDDKGGPPGTGQMILVLDPDRLGGPGTRAHCARLALAVSDEPGARLPGRRRLMARATAQREGIVIAPELATQLEAL